MAGFIFSHRVSGASPTYQTFTFANTETITRGDLLNLSGSAGARRVAPGATSNTNFIGVASQTKAGTTNVSTMLAVTDVDAVYQVVDNNARQKGDTLDIAGLTGAQAVATSSNKEFVVVANSTATQPTLVRFNVGKHLDNKAQ